MGEMVQWRATEKWPTLGDTQAKKNFVVTQEMSAFCHSKEASVET